ncbi:MAG: hypothetical protein KKF30_03860 [Proteobacteria bacterium]|nr:hypothetical protein [Pseudomonadota bacterium]MBU4470976.1 hypothetical protein [Pseudomonadota bacterium]MCG2751075.1 hypothetical protein [Desulfobacteraceae bacterium]
MSAERIKVGNNKKKRDPDFITAEIAMKRASEKAREKAKRVGAGVVVLKEGRIVEEEQDLAV